jgi:hypothetical protein
MMPQIQLETRAVESITEYESSDNQIHETVDLYVPRSKEGWVQRRFIYSRLETYAKTYRETTDAHSIHTPHRKMNWFCRSEIRELSWKIA